MISNYPVISESEQSSSVKTQFYKEFQKVRSLGPATFSTVKSPGGENNQKTAIRTSSASNLALKDQKLP